MASSKVNTLGFEGGVVCLFKIQMTVIDGTGTACFLLWHREWTQLLGKTSAVVKNGIDSVSSSNDKVTTPSKAWIKSAISDDGPENSATKRSIIVRWICRLMLPKRS
ncbi:Uncharacterized protein Fot_06958 [Forsythia ovata]|uniref:Uncharacterized protein n=1 Tax=Forsythia ovata TaxID=205694 RepID=A0ABD1WUJ2_9LAMI